MGIVSWLTVNNERVYIGEKQIMILTEEEIIEITERKQYTQQAKILRFLGITFMPRPDGSLVVLKMHVEKLLGGFPDKPVRVKSQPNWNQM